MRDRAVTVTLGKTQGDFMGNRIIACAIAAGMAAFACAGLHAQTVMQGAEVTPAAYSAQLPSLSGAPVLGRVDAEEPHVKELKHPPVKPKDIVVDTAVQGQPAGTSAAVTPGLGFDGIGVGLGGYQPSSAPPDTTGAVGATQYVQWVNTDFAVFDKTNGALLYGPVTGNTLFANLGGACATSNDGDPIVQYDKAANRWVLSQFAVPGGTAGYWQCVAVSQTSDATGAWNLYAFPAPNFNDYPKVGVWSDGYYVTFNMFTSTFVGARVCAYDRASMIAGTAATQQCFQLSSAYDSLLPADIDGLTAPPAGSPNYLVSLLNGALGMWKFHVDWSNAANSTLTGPIAIATAPYNLACGGGICIPQSSSRQLLDSLGDRAMFRLAYRNLSGTETMVVNHSVMANATRKRGSGNSAVRWYEIRNMATTPSVYQQATFSPDSKYRWMGSAAMDKQGNMAVGYSVSSALMHPGLAYATRLAGDAPGVLSGETTIVSGGGSQQKRLERWGDYTHMSVDPVDDCTFWYVGQYLKANGTFNWSTRIASFKIASCS
jgi:hypothetical protein